MSGAEKWSLRKEKRIQFDTWRRLTRSRACRDACAVPWWNGVPTSLFVNIRRSRFHFSSRSYGKDSKKDKDAAGVASTLHTRISNVDSLAGKNFLRFADSGWTLVCNVLLAKLKNCGQAPCLSVLPHGDKFFLRDRMECAFKVSCEMYRKCLRPYWCQMIEEHTNLNQRIHQQTSNRLQKPRAASAQNSA